MKDTFTLWAHQDKTSGEITWVAAGPKVRKEWASAAANFDESVVKLECRIVQPKRKPKINPELKQHNEHLPHLP